MDLDRFLNQGGNFFGGLTHYQWFLLLCVVLLGLAIGFGLKICEFFMDILRSLFGKNSQRETIVEEDEDEDEETPVLEGIAVTVKFENSQQERHADFETLVGEILTSHGATIIPFSPRVNINPCVLLEGVITEQEIPRGAALDFTVEFLLRAKSNYPKAFETDKLDEDVLYEEYVDDKDEEMTLNKLHWEYLADHTELIYCQVPKMRYAVKVRSSCVLASLPSVYSAHLSEYEQAKRLDALASSARDIVNSQLDGICKAAEVLEKGTTLASFQNR